MKTSRDYVADGEYKLREPYYNEDVVQVFEKLVGKYREAGIKVAFVFTPYHHSVFRKGNVRNWTYLEEVEKRVRRIAYSKKVSVFGSYDPKNVGREEDEFYNDTHPKKSCLRHIQFEDNFKY